MTMDVREKLIELLDRFVYDEWYGNDDIADKLISNGVTVQICRPEDKKTNADRIRSMSDEELAMFLCTFRSCNADEYICDGCKAAQYCRAGHAGTIDWLQQPAEEADNG